MTETETNPVEFKVSKNLTTLNIAGTLFEVTPVTGDVTVYTNDGVQTKAVGKHAATEHTNPSVSIRPDFKAAVAYGALLEMTETGPAIRTTGKVRIMPVPANDVPAPPEELEVGIKMPDGAIFVGISPDTKELMYAAPADEPLLMSFKKALERAAEFSKATGQNYRVPSEAELDMIFNNRAAIDGINTTAGGISSLYRSSTRGTDFTCAKVRDFSRGEKRNVWKSSTLTVRLVRS